MQVSLAAGPANTVRKTNWCQECPTLKSDYPQQLPLSERPGFCRTVVLWRVPGGSAGCGGGVAALSVSALKGFGWFIIPVNPTTRFLLPTKYIKVRDRPGIWTKYFCKNNI